MQKEAFQAAITGFDRLERDVLALLLDFDDETTDQPTRVAFRALTALTQEETEQFAVSLGDGRKGVAGLGEFSMNEHFEWDRAEVRAALDRDAAGFLEEYLVWCGPSSGQAPTVDPELVFWTVTLLADAANSLD